MPALSFCCSMWASLVVASEGYSPVVVCELLIDVASLWSAGSRACGLSGCSM